jgi:hypothetical protein
MKIHKKARLAPARRPEMVHHVLEREPTHAAAAAGHRIGAPRAYAAGTPFDPRRGRFARRVVAPVIPARGIDRGPGRPSRRHPAASRVDCRRFYPGGFRALLSSNVRCLR